VHLLGCQPWKYASLLFVDSQQDSAVEDFARQLLYSTELTIEWSAAVLELGARVCGLSRQSNDGHPSSCATQLLSSSLAHWCCDTALHLIAVWRSMTGSTDLQQPLTMSLLLSIAGALDNLQPALLCY